MIFDCPHISHEIADVSFNYRVCGVAISQDRVLAVQIEPYTFWILPGGRAEYLESTQETLKREVLEETGYPCEVEKLLWVVEDFYPFEGKKVHELGFYYLIDLPVEAKNCSSWIVSEDAKDHEEAKNLKFMWLSLKDLSEIDLLPKYLKERLLQIPESVEHFVNVSL